MTRLLRIAPCGAWLMTVGLGCASADRARHVADTPTRCSVRVACDGVPRDARVDAASVDAVSVDAASVDAASVEAVNVDAASVDAGSATECRKAVPCDSDGGVPDGVCTATGECEEKVTLAVAQHVEGDVQYPDPPPAGGPHNGCWGTWGVHETPLTDEKWVHNLEHGGVVLLYNCAEGCAPELKELAAFVQHRQFTLLTAYPEMPTRFAFVAWGYRLLSDTLDRDALLAFFTAHVDNAPESISSGPPAGCP